MGKILALLLLVVLVSAQNTCYREQDCDRFSEKKEYVTCLNGVCSCWTNRGFAGNATINNKCRCDRPNQVYESKREPGRADDSYCVDIAIATEEVLREQRCKLYENVSKTIYDYVVYPNNLKILSGEIDLHRYVNTDAHSRFTPVGEFTGLEGFIEYYYALGASPAGFVQSVKFRTLACDNNVVHFRVDLFFNQTLNPVGPPIRNFNFTHVGYFVFDQSGLIEIADITFTNMGATADVPADATVILPPNPDPIRTRDAIIAGLCYQAIPQFCTGANQQFSSPEECLGFMYSIPYGSFDRANSNTVTCRLVHSGLIPTRPNIHCPHVGPTGGGKCVDFPVVSYYQSIIETTLNKLVPAP